MRLLTPIVPDASAPMARANPVAKLAAGFLILIALFSSLDVVTALIILAVLIALLPVSGISASALLGRVWLVGIAAVSIGVINILFAPEQLGSTVVAVGQVRIGGETFVNGVGLGVRLLGVGLTGILSTATSDPTEMADALVQHMRVSHRFAIGVLAALRLLPLLAREWQTIGLARRARGVDAGRSPIASVRLFAGRLLALLVGAIRRGSRMALAMEARGFGAMPCRTVARRQRMRAGDWAWIAAAAALGALAIAISIALGTWRPLLG